MSFDPARITRFLRLARGLRYRTLTEVVGKTVTVASVASVVSDVLGPLSGLLPPSSFAVADSARSLFAGTMAKYGLLDLELPLSTGASEALRRLSRQDLHEMGFLTEPSRGESDDGFCLDLLLEDVMVNHAVIKIILDAAGDDRSPEERIQHYEIGVPPGYLPRRFVVRDACVTNAPSIWLGKHLYL